MRIGELKDRFAVSRTGDVHPLSVLRRSRQVRAANGLRASDRLGFTLLELMIVLTLILIIVSIATPMYDRAILRAREAVLRDDLYTMRNLIDQFTLDKERPPQSLEELVDAGYLRGGVPQDPITRSRDTWRVDFDDVVVGTSQALPGIVDVHSGSDEIASDGMTPYSSW